MMLAAALLIAAASPPAARPRPLDPAESQLSTDTAVRTMHAFAECTARTHGADAVRLIMLEPGSQDFRDLATRISTADCLGPVGFAQAHLRFQPDLLVSGLYEALYRRQFPNASLDFGAVPPLTYPWPQSTVEPTRRATNAMSLGIGECVVRAAPAQAKALLATHVTRPDEAAAFDALRPHLPGCVPAGVTLSFSRPNLRGFVAAALYRLAMARPAAGAPPGSAR